MPRYMAVISSLGYLSNLELAWLFKAPSQALYDGQSLAWLLEKTLGPVSPPIGMGDGLLACLHLDSARDM